MSEIEDAINANLAGPKKAMVDGVSVEQHSLADLIAVDKHLASKAAAKSTSRGLLMTKLGLPGATD